MASAETSQRIKVYIAGAPGGSSIAPPVHNFIAKQLDKPWNVQFMESESIEDVINTFRGPQFAGGIVTMPWKKAIIPYLDEVDDKVSLIGACNLVVRLPSGRLRGTNVDWVGIKIPLLQARPRGNATCGMICGAGGASRAALYVLAVELRLETIYIVNRDDAEVADFLKDALAYQTLVNPHIVHVKSADQAKNLDVPSYVISTVPDLEAKTLGELEARATLREFLSRGQGSGGVVLDMCYHPKITHNLQLALDYEWITVEGTNVTASQLKVQWQQWTGQEISEEVEVEAFAMLDSLALADKTVTPDAIFCRSGRS
jgi:quinate dehydrogenase